MCGRNTEDPRWLNTVPILPSSTAPASAFKMGSQFRVKKYLLLILLHLPKPESSLSPSYPQRPGIRGMIGGIL